jgi:hypothetical protein
VNLWDPDGTSVVTATPWWESTTLERDGRQVSRGELDEISVPIDGDPNAISRQRLTKYVESAVKDPDVWTQVVPDHEVEALWRGVEWDSPPR